MATPASTERVRAVVEPAAVASGLVLDGLEIVTAGRRSVVRVTLDLPDDAVGGLDLDTLAETARAISLALDEQAPVDGEYTLEVSTPGTDRPLTEPRHFRRARTRLVRMTLRAGGVVLARLVEVTDTELTLTPVDAQSGRDVAGDPLHIALADVESASVEVELSRARVGDDSGGES